jgi:rRNA maturation endonuclease Nob1
MLSKSRVRILALSLFISSLTTPSYAQAVAEPSKELLNGQIPVVNGLPVVNGQTPTEEEVKREIGKIISGEALIKAQEAKKEEFVRKDEPQQETVEKVEEGVAAVPTNVQGELV